MSESCLHRCRARFNIDLHPSTSGNVLKGVREELALRLVKYNEDLDGVLLSYSNMRVLNVEATVRPYFPYYQVEVAADVVLFKPAVGSRLCGTVGTIGEDYIGLLVLGLFNAVLYREALPAHWRCRGAEACWVSSKDRRRLEVGTVVNFAVTQVVHDSDVFAISASLLESGTGISDTQITADQAPPPASIFATAAAVAASAPLAAPSNGNGQHSAPQASQPREDRSFNKKLENGARVPLLAGRDVSSVQQDAAESSGDGLRPGKRRKGVGGDPESQPTAWETSGVSPAAAEAPGPEQYVSKKELRLIRQAAAAAAVLAAAAGLEAAAAAADGRIDTGPADEAAVQLHFSGCNGSALEGAQSMPKKKKRKHTSSIEMPAPVEKSIDLQAASDGTLPADETAGDTSKRRKKHKSQNLEAAAASVGGAPVLIASTEGSYQSMQMDSDALVELPKKKKKRKEKAQGGEE